MTNAKVNTMTEKDWAAGMEAVMTQAANDGGESTTLHTKLTALIAQAIDGLAAAGNTELAASLKGKFKMCALEDYATACAVEGAVAGICYGKRAGLRTGIAAFTAASRDNNPVALMHLLHATTDNDTADAVIIAHQTNG